MPHKRFLSNFIPEFLSQAYWKRMNITRSCVCDDEQKCEFIWIKLNEKAHKFVSNLNICTVPHLIVAGVYIYIYVYIVKYINNIQGFRWFSTWNVSMSASKISVFVSLWLALFLNICPFLLYFAYIKEGDSCPKWIIYFGCLFVYVTSI